MKSISFSIWLKGKISAIHLEQYQLLVEACNCNYSLYSCDKVKHFIWYIFWQMLHWICLAWINMFLQHMSHLSMTIYVEYYHTQFHNGFNELNSNGHTIEFWQDWWMGHCNKRGEEYMQHIEQKKTVHHEEKNINVSTISMGGCYWISIKFFWQCTLHFIFYWNLRRSSEALISFIRRCLSLTMTRPSKVQVSRMAPALFKFRAW